jgi:hypothetical protein
LENIAKAGDELSETKSFSGNDGGTNPIEYEISATVAAPRVSISLRA